MPFHIIIGETHLHEASVKLAHKLLDVLKYDTEKLIMCFEHPEQVDIPEYYKENASLATTLSNRASVGDDSEALIKIIEQEKLKYPSINPSKTLLLNLFGKERILAFNNVVTYCTQRNIKLLGIDIQLPYVASRENVVDMRSMHHINKLKELDEQGISTIMVVGQGHLATMYKYSKEIKFSCQFISVEDKKDFFALHANSHESVMKNKGFHTALTMYMPTSVDQKTAEQIKDINDIFRVSFDTLANAEFLVCEKFKLVKNPQLNQTNTPSSASQNDFAKNLKKGFILKEYEAENIGLAFRKAAAKGHLKNVEFLFSFGLDINAGGTNSKKTALHLAVQHGHIKVVQFLVAKNAQLDLVDINSKRAEDYAATLEIKEVLSQTHKTAMPEMTI